MYNSAHQFTPLMPADAKQEALLVKAHELVIEALRLPGQPAAELRKLLRGMNSYYSNRIEGQHTRPLELEQALRRDFSAEPELAARQRMALAHMDAEGAIEAAYPDESAIASIYQVQTVQAMHTELFKRLPQSELVTADGEIITPGQARCASRPTCSASLRRLAEPAPVLEPAVQQCAAWRKKPPCGRRCTSPLGMDSPLH
jgi:hypothetical protein